MVHCAAVRDFVPAPVLFQRSLWGTALPAPASAYSPMVTPQAIAAFAGGSAFIHITGLMDKTVTALHPAATPCSPVSSSQAGNYYPPSLRAFYGLPRDGVEKVLMPGSLWK
jgi:hypothetical protein